jgi:phosphopantothenate-cysteine ligase/phosphopantothenoylcysteine decarboxylase/phosphopantothenate--cysteine ligase
MRILVTAGNTRVPVDQVRCITNIFTGRTGTRLAIEGNRRGHDVVLLTSHPQLVGEQVSRRGAWKVESYQTFDDLHNLLADLVPGSSFDVIIHCAAIADYQVNGIYAVQEGTQFEPSQLRWHGTDPTLVDISAGKVKSTHAEVWLRMTPTPKLVDHFRTIWSFLGKLVKFKLEVGISDAELLWIAEKSRLHSRADYMVANTLEGVNNYAFLGPVEGEYRKISRLQLASELWNLLER